MVPDPSLTPELIQARAFTQGFRGYDHTEVRDFLTRIASEVRALRERAEQLESAWRSAEERAARPPVLDEETLMAAVGEETAAILRSARAAASDMRSKAAEESERAITEAREEADRIRAEAETVLADERKNAEEAAAGIAEAARQEAAQLVENARSEAEAIRAKAEQDRNLTIEGATSTRERILEDLSRRRRVASVQIEQLRAGRERLLEAYAVVRRTMEEAHEELTKADAEARAAADDVGRRLRHDAELGEGEHGLDEIDGGSVPERQLVAEDGSPADGGSSAHATEDEDGSAAVVATATAAEAPGAGAPHGRNGKGSPVEQLFARIRGAQESGAEESEGPSGEEPLIAPEAVAEPTAEVQQSESELPVGNAADEEANPEVADSERPAATEAPDPTTEETPGSETWLQRRESQLVDLETGLTRKLKRALQDEQNDILDRLRGLRSEASPSSLLPSLDEHMGRYTGASLPLVERAASAGAAFAGDVLGPSAVTGAANQVDDLATEAAASIVQPLRRRLEEVISSGAGEEQPVLIESLGAAYREWKSQRIERVAGDVLAAAFSRGTWNASPEGTSFRWIVEDVDGPCPDCDDDALAGDLPKGEPFPTGQPHPPAHSGCRCLLVPVRG